MHCVGKGTCRLALGVFASYAFASTLTSTVWLPLPQTFTPSHLFQKPPLSSRQNILFLLWSLHDCVCHFPLPSSHQSTHPSTYPSSQSDTLHLSIQHLSIHPPSCMYLCICPSIHHSSTHVLSIHPPSNPLLYIHPFTHQPTTHLSTHHPSI